MLSHALEHASQNNEFDNMIAILGLDNTIEYILRSISTHLDLESVTGKSFDIFDLSSLAASINKTLNEYANIRLPYIGEIKLLRQTRNLVQHGAVAPQADLERFTKIVERFFNTVLIRIFGFDIKELKISSVIENELVKNYLQEAEIFLDKEEWLKSIIASRNAFENAYFNKIKNLDLSISLYPALVYAREKNDISSYAWDVVKDELELAYLGINTPEHHRFKEYLRHIPHEFCSEDSWGQIVMQRPWNRQDAIFCYNYVANTIIRWQIQEKDQLYIPKIDKEYIFKETIGGVSITKNAQTGCYYIYDKEEVLLIYAEKSIKRRIERLSKNKDYIYRTIQYVDGKKESESKRYIRILGIHTFLIVNEPERWGIVLWFRESKGRT